MTTFPSLFISHGAPDLILHPGPTFDFLQQLGAKLGKPRAIVVVSAHWLSPVPTLSTVLAPETIHDFWGFPEELSRMHYPAPGAAEVAEQAAHLLTAHGIDWRLDPSRGLDHGAWVPLRLMYPEADIPVTQLSVQPRLNPTHHLAVGRAIAPLRKTGVLILASGSTTHNLQAATADVADSAAPDWVKRFDDWLAGAIASSNLEDLLDYRQQAPDAAHNHPTDEHLLPLFVALGAGGPNPIGTQIHAHMTNHVLSMAAYQFA